MRLNPEIWRASGAGTILAAAVLGASLWSNALFDRPIEHAAPAAPSALSPGPRYPDASRALDGPGDSGTPRDREARALQVPDSPGSGDRTTDAGARSAKFGSVKASHEVRIVADWIARSGDNLDHDFIIVDKQGAQLYLFDASANLRSSTPVLIGAAIGDHSVEDIGTRPIAAIRPEERTTPAGRFVAEPGHNADDEPVIWIDHSVAVSMHAVRSAARQRRLDTPGAHDNRISYGCINVPKPFFDQQIRKVFTHRTAIVYVLPDVLSLHEVFPGITRGG